MSSSNNNQPTKDSYPPTSPVPPNSDRRASFLSSLFYMPSSSNQPAQRPDNSLSSSTSSHSTASLSPSYSSSATHHTENSNLTGSPASSVTSPIDPKFSPIDWSNSGSPHSRQTSLSDSLGGLTSSFRWPGSPVGSKVQPISIPNSTPSQNLNPTSTSITGASAPTRRTSIGGPTFRRAFELPTYTNTNTLQDSPNDLSTQNDASRRGRSGSLFSSFGVGDASKRASGPPRRKLSPMGERMIRDHPF